MEDDRQGDFRQGSQEDDQKGRSSTPSSLHSTATPSLSSTTSAPPEVQRRHQKLEADIEEERPPLPSEPTPNATVDSRLSDLERAVLAKSSPGPPRTTQPGDVGESSLSQLERDVMAKSGGGPSATRPGAVSVGGAASLTQLERDIMAKNEARPSSATGRPGAAAVTPLASSNLERSVHAKGQSEATSGHSLSQLERDVMEKSSSWHRGTTHPGAVSVSGPCPSSLSTLEQDALSGGREATSRSHLERDVMAQSAARPSGASGPGAVSVPGPGASQGSLQQFERGRDSSEGMSLSQLERDILAKTSNATPGATRPGVVAVTGDGRSNLSQLERDLTASTMPGNMSSTQPQSALSLSQLEKDVLAKRAASGSEATRPGVVAVSGDGRSNLSQLERDIAAKNEAAAPGQPRPGAFAVSIEGRSSLSHLERYVTTKAQASAGASSGPPREPTSLSQLEKDIMAKRAARGSEATQPGAVTVSEEGRSSLSQLERDVAAKNEGYSPGEPRPGAFAVSSEGRSSLSHLEQGATAKSEASSGPPRGAASLSQLEQDVMAKRASRDSGATQPGAVAVSGGGRSSLSQLELDIAAKNEAHTPGQSNPGAVAVRNDGRPSLSQLEQDVTAKPQASVEAPGRRFQESTSLSQLEQDILSKRQEQEMRGRMPLRPGAVSVSGDGRSSLSQLERDVAAKNEAALSGQSRPGTIAVSNEGRSGISQLELDVAARSAPPRDTPSSSLNQLERDILAKRSQDSARTKKPGAINVPSEGRSNLSQLERDVVTKTEASQGQSVAFRSATSFSQLEQDIVRKQSAGAQGAWRPGTVEVRASENLAASQLQSDSDLKSEEGAGFGGTESSLGPAAVSGRSSLSRLEQDVAAKRAADRPSPGSPATFAPGAVAVPGPGRTSLSQMEHDIAAKTSSPSTPMTGFSLSQLEEDILTKTGVDPGRGAPSQQSLRQSNRSADATTASDTMVDATSPGAASISGDGRSIWEDLDQRAAAKAPPGAGPRVPSDAAATLSNLERDVLAKTSGTRQGPLIAAEGLSLARFSNELAQTPGGSTWASLREMENDLLAKASNRQTADTTHTQSTLRESLANAALNLQSLEADITAKQGVTVAVRTGVSGNVSEQSGTALSSIQALESNVLAKDATRPATGVPVQETLAAVGWPADSSVPNRMQPFEMEDFASQQRGYERPYESNEYAHPPPPYFVPETRYVDQGQEGPLVPGTSNDAALGGGIEAFTVDGHVVDATGVAVIMSEEEEARLSRKRQNRLFCGLGSAVVVLIVIIVVSIVLTVGKGPSSGAVAPTAMPSVAPSMMPSMTPTTDSLQEVISAVMPYSGSGVFKDKDSPQYLAANWLANEDEYSKEMGLTGSDQKFLQRYALAVFYFALGGESWRICGKDSLACVDSDLSINNWLSSTDDCTWYEVACGDGPSGLQPVTEISFILSRDAREQDLTFLKGTLPMEMSMLSDLADFIVVDMMLQGSLEGRFANAKNLEQLFLFNNSFTGGLPEKMPEQNPKLFRFVVSQNELNGTIPTSFGTLERLRHLQIDQNYLTGRLPEELFANTTVLETFEAFDNLLTGELPTSLYQLSTLEVLQLQKNSFEGRIDESINNMVSLNELRLGQSQLGGRLPSALFGLPNLVILDLSGGQFTGDIYDIGPLNDTLKDLILNDNFFTGTVPEALGNFGIIEVILLYGNRNLTGTMPEVFCGRRGNAGGLVQTMTVACETIACSCCNECVPLSP